MALDAEQARSSAKAAPPLYRPSPTRCHVLLFSIAHQRTEKQHSICERGKCGICEYSRNGIVEVPRILTVEERKIVPSSYIWEMLAYLIAAHALTCRDSVLPLPSHLTRSPCLSSSNSLRVDNDDR